MTISELIAQRERAMDSADAALDKAWPARKGAAYLKAMQDAAAEIRRVAAALQTTGAAAIEQSRTLRYLGSIYSDLAPALGREWLTRARDAYLEADRLIPASEQGMERAKLNFNFANTLSQLDPDNGDLLNEARSRVETARAIFAKQSPQYLAQVEQLTATINRLLTLVPTIQAVRRARADLESAGRRIREGGDLQEIARDLRRIGNRGGGVAGLAGQLRAAMANLPAAMKDDPRFAAANQMLDGLTARPSAGGQATAPETEIVSMLRERLKREGRQGTVDAARAKTLDGLIGEIERFAPSSKHSIEDLIEYTESIRGAIAERMELPHYPSYGIPRPPAGSRAAEMVEECWTLRRFLLEEMSRPDKGSDESNELLQLNIRGSNVDKRIYEAGGDDAHAGRLEQEELRPFALAVRAFSARSYAMFAAPIWTGPRLAVDTNTLLYAGPGRHAASMAKACSRLNIELIPPPAGASFAQARWQQIQRAMLGVFDFRAPDGPQRAAVAYELGIALTLGRPVVTLVAAGDVLPFDVDREPVVAETEKQTATELKTAIRRAVVSTYAPSHDRGAVVTLDEALSRHARPHDNVYVDQMLRLLANQKEEPDPLAIGRTLAKLVQFLDDGHTVLISPAWPPVYPSAVDRRLFHVMPFKPAWASDAASAARAACSKAGVRYVRGDEAADVSVIHSIWEELARATHVLVDLTGFNANVALELGIAHTLGRQCLLVGQGDTVRSLFPMIAKQRVFSYDTPAQLGRQVAKFLQ